MLVGTAAAAVFCPFWPEAELELVVVSKAAFAAALGGFGVVELG